MAGAHDSADEDFAWADALGLLDGGLLGGGGDGLAVAEDMLLDAGMLAALEGEGEGATAHAGTAAHSSSANARRCRIRGCSTPLGSAYSQRAKLCEAHLRAPTLELPDGSGAGRFCQRCHALQPLSDFAGSKRTCAAALAAYNRKRRDAVDAARADAAAAAACALAVARPLRAADEALPIALEASLQACMDAFLLRARDTRLAAAAAAELWAPITVLDARALLACIPPNRLASASMSADADALAAHRAAMSAEDAAEAPAWCAPTVAQAQRAEQHIALLATIVLATGGEIAALRAKQLQSAPDRAYLAMLVDAAGAMASFVAQTQSALALLRLESRGRYVGAAALACTLAAALLRRMADCCTHRVAWLTERAAAQACAPTKALAAQHTRAGATRVSKSPSPLSALSDSATETASSEQLADGESAGTSAAAEAALQQRLLRCCLHVRTI